MSIQTKDIVNLWRRQPVLCSCGLVALGLLLSLYFRMGDREAVETVLAEQTKVRNRQSANIKYGVGLDAHTERLRKVNAELASDSLKVGELALNQQFFLRLEADTGVKLLDLRPLPVAAPAKDAPANAFVPIGFSLSVTGTYDQLIAFVTRLEEGATLGRVLNGGLAGSDTGTQTLSLTVELLGLRS